MKADVKEADDNSRPGANQNRTQSEQRRTERELEGLNAELLRQAAYLRQVNQTLLDSEHRLRLAIETGRIGLWVWNSTDLENVGDWSTRLKEIFGLPLDAEVTHDMFLKCVHPEDRERVDQLVHQALAGINGGEYRAEYRTIHPRDGSEHWVTARGQAFFDSAGKAMRFIGTVMDITERKRAEESSIRLNLELEQRIAERTEALRTSEHVARGQLEAMTTTLTALSRESEPEKFLEHVLRTIGWRLGAQSLGVWEMNVDTGRAQLAANFEDDRLRLATREEIEASQQVELAPQDHPVWTQFFRNGEYCVFGEIDATPPRVRVADRSDTQWHHWFGDGEVNPISRVMMKRLSALGIVAVLCLPMFVGGKVTGLISVRFRQKRAFGCGEVELARALAHQVMLAIQLMRLSWQSRQAAVVAERDRMARDIHDTLAQGLTGVIVQLEAAEDALTQNLAEDAAAHLERASELARDSLREARRSVAALRPLALAGKNLCAAMDELIRKMTVGTNLHAEFTVEGEPPPLPQGWEENLLHVSQEVLTNTLRHARAGHFKVHFVFDPRNIRLELRDDGCGFHLTRRHDGFGLQGMEERVKSMGGELRVVSSPENGTAVFVTLPLIKIPPPLTL